MKAYTFAKKTSTKEVHIFEGTFGGGNCQTSNTSICEKMKKSDGALVNACNTEQQARDYAAKTGRPVCGDCVSHLYTTY
jgi:hypothetical protein